MGQRTMLEAKGNTLALHVLLPHTAHHLGDVDEGALGPARHHLDNVVAQVQGVLRTLARVITRFIEHCVHAVLERLLDGAPRLLLQLATLVGGNDLLHLLLGLLNNFIDGCHRAVVSNRVSDANAHAMLQQPVVGRDLEVVNQAACIVWAVLQEGDVDEATPCSSQRLFAQHPHHQLSTPDEHLRVVQGQVLRVAILVPGSCASDVDIWQEQAVHLLAGP
mmetsp:Transcript_14393/g.39002  ORF Transcript_14393/g.39002 Transcript_14393/m.39002 type:complete len:220 (-) Transcript_14393:1793-2452(-)